MKPDNKNTDSEKLAAPERNFERATLLLESLLDLNLPDDVRDELIGWFQSGVRQEEKYAALESIINNLECNPFPGKEDHEAYRRIHRLLGFPEERNTGKPARKLSLRRIGLRVAAVLLPVVMIVGGYLWYDNARTPDNVFTATHTISVPAEGPRHIILPDGTEVTLNQGSEFAYDDNRGCSLKGEAYFKVTKSNTPFVVHTDKIDVTVLGTEFNLNAYPDEEFSTVTLYSGAVDINYQEGSHRLEPGTEFSYNNLTREISTRPVDATDGSGKPSWMRASSQAYSLGEIFLMIESEYGVSIENKEIADTTQVYTFMLDGSPLNTVMTAVKVISGDFDYTLDGDTIVIEKVKK